MCEYRRPRGRRGSWAYPLVAVAAGGGTAIAADEVMVDPLRDQAAGLVQRRLGVVDAVQGRAGPERVQVGRAVAAQIAVGGDHGALAAARDMAGIPAQLTLVPRSNGAKCSDRAGVSQAGAEIGAAACRDRGRSGIGPKA